MLKSLAQTGAPIDEIARTLKRSASAIRNKAGMHGISLATARLDNGQQNRRAVGAGRCA